MGFQYGIVFSPICPYSHRYNTFLPAKKIGWTLFAVFLTYNSISAIFAFVTMLQMQQSGFSRPFGLFPTSLSVGTIFFFIGSLWVICKANIREVYTISTKTMWRTIGFISTICLIVLFGLSRY